MAAVSLNVVIALVYPICAQHAHIDLDAQHCTPLPACTTVSIFGCLAGHRSSLDAIKTNVELVGAMERCAVMNCFLGIVVLSAVTTAQLSVADAQSKVSSPQSELVSATASAGLAALPPAPLGKSTILGGEIRRVDPVRDELTLKVFGQRPVKILFDERTQVYSDGKKIPLRALVPSDHASVQTVLDGTDVYALSVHVISRSPEGEYQGRVLNYSPGTGELTISSAMLHEPFKLRVPANTPVTRVGQPAFASLRSGSSDLVAGALISVKFESDKSGRGVAREVTVLATPGSAFEFSGNLSSLDMHSGLLVVVDPADDKSYQISFDSAILPASRNLHEGDHVRVTASFDGNHYVASSLTAN
jgi:hypothetical protein